MTTGTSRTVIVVGASRGLGKGIANALEAPGTTVVAVPRTAPDAGDGVVVEWADATDPAVARRLLGRYEPDAGHASALRQRWDDVSAAWGTDVRVAFEWLGEALRRPPPPGGRCRRGQRRGGGQIALSGGYAGAKATQRSLATYPRRNPTALPWISASPPSSRASRR